MGLMKLRKDGEMVHPSHMWTEGGGLGPLGLLIHEGVGSWGVRLGSSCGCCAGGQDPLLAGNSGCQCRMGPLDGGDSSAGVRSR